MNHRQFPSWYRAYVFIPFLGILYVIIPLFVWNFSPHALTHTTPDFLLGATDWGSGNVYTFTKIAYWIGLVLGCIANLKVVSEEKPPVRSFLMRWRLNMWHLGAALIIPFMTLPGGLSTDTIDMWLLFAYFAFTACIILWLLTVAQKNNRLQYIIISFLIAIAWGFLPVSLGRP